MSPKLSLMGRGSKAGGNCNTIEKLRGAAGNASRKIIIFLERPRTGQEGTVGQLGFGTDLQSRPPPMGSTPVSPQGV